VISHPHADHFAGLAEALDSIEIGTFVDRTQIVAPGGAAPGGVATGGATNDPGSYSARGAEAGKYLELRARLAARGCRCLPASSGATLTFDSVGITLYTPARPLVLLEGGEPWGPGRDPPSGDELNGGSVVALLDIGGVHVLLPGDAESDTLEPYRVPALDVLVVPHHGSRGAVSGPLLEALHPGLAVISVGKDNTFGHPDPATVALLGTAGKTVVRTDESGWVSLRMTDGAITVTTERTRAP
jgi:competence protein ComEC